MKIIRMDEGYYAGLLFYLRQFAPERFFDALGGGFLEGWVATLLGVERVWLDFSAPHQPNEIPFVCPKTGQTALLLSFPAGSHAEPMYHRLNAAICRDADWLAQDWSVAVYTAGDVLRVLPESLDELVQRFGAEPDHEVIRL